MKGNNMSSSCVKSSSWLGNRQTLENSSLCSISASSVIKMSNRDDKWSKSGPYQKLVASKWFCGQQFRLSLQLYSGDNCTFYECKNGSQNISYGHFRFWDKEKLVSILAEQPVKILPKFTPVQLPCRGDTRLYSICVSPPALQLPQYDSVFQEHNTFSMAIFFHTAFRWCMHHTLIL